MKNLIKPISAFSLISLLVACGGSKLPDPTPLTAFPPSANIQKSWSASPNDGNDELLFKLTPATDDHLLYAAGHDGRISAINIETGKKIWSQRYKDLPFSSNIALTSHELYLGTDDAQIVKLDKVSGAIVWTKSVPSTVIAAPIATSDEVFSKTINGEITVLNTKTGDTIWNYQQTLPSLILRDTSNPVLQDNALLIGFSNGTLIGFDQTSGNNIWTKQVSLPEGKTDVERMADISATPKVVDNTVYAAAYQGAIIAFNLQTQDTLWSANVSTYNDFTISDNAIFVGDTQGNVVAIDRASGTILWKQDALRYRYLTAPTYIGNDMIAIADKEGYLHILDAKTGQFIARTSVNSDGIITAPLYVNGLTIIQANDGHLYAYKISKNKKQ